jgi:hypothetical protein
MTTRDVPGPVPGHPGFDRLEVGDRVVVPQSGRTGVIVRRCPVPRDGWIVRWDEPRFGAVEGRIATPNIERVRPAPDPDHERETMPPSPTPHARDLVREGDRVKFHADTVERNTYQLVGTVTDVAGVHVYVEVRWLTNPGRRLTSETAVTFRIPVELVEVLR